MHYLDLTLPSPEENLALDEALLDACEAGQGGLLRFWQADRYFVVVGYANAVGTEVNAHACEQDGIPILRRCTGGGTVLQGPTCLNYALVLRIDSVPGLQTIHRTNEYVLQHHAHAVSTLTGKRVDQQGHTDLAIAGAKFSGNAQRRRRNALLFHGSFLLSMDITRIERYLLPPSKEPEYRRKRSHREFLMNLNVPAEKLKLALRQAWQAVEPFAAVPHSEVERLVRERYSRREWNLKV